MDNGQGVNPDPPAPPLEFDRVVEQDLKDLVDQLLAPVLGAGLGGQVAQGQHPVLPDRLLQEDAAVVMARLEQAKHVGQEQ